MRYAPRQKNGLFINVEFPNDALFASIYVDSQLQRHYAAEFDGDVFFLSKELWTVSMIEMQGGKYGVAKSVDLLDENGTVYILDWERKKFGTLGTVYVPVKSKIPKFMPEDLIPEAWRPFKQIYIDHIAIKFHPFDYCTWRFDDLGKALTPVQSICLDGVDYAIKRWVSMDRNGGYKTLRFVNDKMRSLALERNIFDPIDSLELVEPLVLKPLEELLLKNEIYEVLPRFKKAKESCLRLVTELKETPIKVSKPLTEYEAPF